MKILIAPNSFKESASALEIAEIIKECLKEHGLKDISEIPVSDGGDGFLEICTLKFGLKKSYFNIRNCYNDNVTAKPVASDDEEKSFFIESADFVGMRNIPEEKRQPLKLNSSNVGELLSELDKKQKIEKVTIGIGGTGTVDLGLGLCVPFGLKLFDKASNELEVIPENYIKAEHIKLPQHTHFYTEAVLDVNVPISGKNGSVMIFAHQKGVKESELPELDKGFKNILHILKRDHSMPFEKKFFGAGGALSVGLALLSEKFFVTSSMEFLLYKLDLLEEIKACDMVITGEGRYDSQSLLNKAPGIIITEAVKRKKQAVLIAGKAEIPEEKIRREKITVYDLTSILGSKENALKYFRQGIKSAINDLIEKTGRNR